MNLKIVDGFQHVSKITDDSDILKTNKACAIATKGQ